MSRYFVPLQQPQVRNALIDFSPINAGLDSIRDQRNTNTRNAMMQQQMDAQKEQQQWARGRAEKQDELAMKDRAGKAAMTVAQMDDNDPAKAMAWQRLLKEYGDGNHSPEELDFRKGPKLLMAAAGLRIDPMDARMQEAKLGLIQAQTSKAQREAVTAGEQFGKNGTIVQDKSGNYYSVQFGSNGQKKIEPLVLGENGLTPSRGVGTLDTGTEFRVYDKSTGGDIRTVEKNVASEKAQEEIGKAQGKAVMDLPRVEDNAALAIQTIKDLRTHPGRKYGLGVAGVLPGIPGTQQRDFVNFVEQAKGKVFLEAFNSLRGGGQITEAEGSKATQALARLDRAQTPEGFDRALKDLEDVIQRGVARAKRATGTQAPQQPQFQLPPGFKLEKVE